MPSRAAEPRGCWPVSPNERGIPPPLPPSPCPRDLTQVLLSGFLLLKPQLINNPLIKTYQILRTLYTRSQVELDMRMKPS